MQTACIHCGAEHLLKDGQFGGHSKVQFKCSNCGKTTIVEIKRRVDSTVVMSPLPSFARANATSSNLNLPPADPGLWQGLVETLMHAALYDETLAVLRRAQAAAGDHPAFTVLETVCFAEKGETSDVRS